jgi:hypothetical protein
MERLTVTDYLDDTLTVTLRLSRAAAKQLVDQLLLPDPTLEADLRKIREQFFASLSPGHADPDSTAV